MKNITRERKITDNLSVVEQTIKEKKFQYIKHSKNLIGYYQYLQYRLYLLEEGIIKEDELEGEEIKTKEDLEKLIKTVGDVMEILGEDTPMIF